MLLRRTKRIKCRQHGSDMGAIEQEVVVKQRELAHRLREERGLGLVGRNRLLFGLVEDDGCTTPANSERSADWKCVALNARRKAFTDLLLPLLLLVHHIEPARTKRTVVEPRTHECGPESAQREKQKFERICEKK
jgi:hypothetical protein